jgi:hypothetical protein
MQKMSDQEKGPYAKYIECQRRITEAKNMRFYLPKYHFLTLYPWVMVCVDLVGSFTIRTSSKTRSLHALTMKYPEINTSWFKISKVTNNIHPEFILQNLVGTLPATSIYCL